MSQGLGPAVLYALPKLDLWWALLHKTGCVCGIILGPWSTIRRLGYQEIIIALYCSLQKCSACSYLVHPKLDGICMICNTRSHPAKHIEQFSNSFSTVTYTMYGSMFQLPLRRKPQNGHFNSSFTETKPSRVF